MEAGWLTGLFRKFKGSGRKILAGISFYYPVMVEFLFHIFSNFAPYFQRE